MLTCGRDYDGDARVTHTHDAPGTSGTRMPAHEPRDLRCYTYPVRSHFTPDRYNVDPLPGRTLSLTAELRVD